MKNMVVGILVVFLVAAFTQPLIEFSNILKDKVMLNAAIRNSCRAARNNALASTDYSDSSGPNMGDMNACIKENDFRRFFAEAFSATLGIEVVDSKVNPMKFKAGKYWNEITVRIDLEYDDISDYDFNFSGRGASMVTVELKTPYLFWTKLLKSAVKASDKVYSINETTVFLVQIMN